MALRILSRAQKIRLPRDLYASCGTVKWNAFWFSSKSNRPASVNATPVDAYVQQESPPERSSNPNPNPNPNPNRNPKANSNPNPGYATTLSNVSASNIRLSSQLQSSTPETISSERYNCYQPEGSPHGTSVPFHSVLSNSVFSTNDWSSKELQIKSPSSLPPTHVSSRTLRAFRSSAVQAYAAEKDRAARWRERVNARRERRQAQAYAGEDSGQVSAHVEPTVLPQVPEPTQPLVGALEPKSVEEAAFASVLARSDLIMTRRVEWANLLIGFEQQNKYTIVDPYQPDQPVGFVVEESNPFLRQLLRSHRPFTASVLDAQGKEIIKIKRPFFFINSTISVETPGGTPIGEAHRRWHLWKRNYDSYVGNRQFGEVQNWGFWWWTFEVKNESGENVAVVDRNWRGFGFELMTDAGQYCVRFGDATGNEGRPQLESLQQQGLPLQQSGTPPEERVEQTDLSGKLSLSERAVVLALAVSLDCDYFSRHQGGMGGFFPFPYFGSEAADTGTGESVPGSSAPVPGGAATPPDFRPSDDAGGGIGGMVAGTAMAEAMQPGTDRDGDADTTPSDAAPSTSDSASEGSPDASEWLSRDTPPEAIFGGDESDDVSGDDGWGDGDGDGGGGGGWFDVFGDGE